MPWRKSTFSYSNGACVEVGANTTAVNVRDTTEETHPYRITLEFTTPAWRQFVAQLRSQ